MYAEILIKLLYGDNDRNPQYDDTVQSEEGRFKGEEEERPEDIKDNWIPKMEIGIDIGIPLCPARMTTKRLIPIRK